MTRRAPRGGHIGGRSGGWRRRLARALLTAALVPAAGLLTGCFEDPVEQSLQIELASDGSAWVDLQIGFRDDSTLADDSPLGRRLAAEREALLGGWDPWSARFAALSPTHETQSWIKNGGTLASLSRSARVAEAAELSDFFADTGIGAFAERGDGWAAFALYPGRPAGAGREQVRQVEETVERWSAHIADYLAATAALYRYLDTHPHRAQACFAYYFEDVMAEATLEPLSDEEEALLSDLVDTSAELLTVFELPDGGAWTLNELSRRVFDPFPADVWIRLPREPLEVEGFAVADGTSLRVPGIGLWPALTALEGEWIAPDPALSWLRAEAAQDAAGTDPAADTDSAADTGSAAFSLDAFVAAPRSVFDLPDERQVEDALRGRLEPAPTYRVVWAVG